MCRVPWHLSVYRRFSAGGLPACVREGSMSVIDLRAHRQSLGSKAWAFDQPAGYPQRASYTSVPSTDFSPDDSIPLFLSDFRGQPDPREFEPSASSHAPTQRTSILMRIVAGALVVSAFAILVAVGTLNSNVKRDPIDNASAPIGDATKEQSAIQAASTQPAIRQIPPRDPALVSDATLTSDNASSPPEQTPSRDAIVSAHDTASQGQAPAAPKANQAAAPSKTLDEETLAALMTRAGRLLAVGDIAAARLLLERAANAQNVTAAFLLAQTYDPAVLGVSDARSTAPDPVIARNWYRTAASLGSADAQRRLTQLQN
jgi:hypothetical protein